MTMTLFEQETIDKMRAAREREERKKQRAKDRAEGEARGEARGEKKGRKEGAFDMLLSLVRDNSITKSTAAKKLGMTLAEFEKKYKEFAKVAVL